MMQLHNGHSPAARRWRSSQATACKPFSETQYLWHSTRGAILVASLYIVGIAQPLAETLSPHAPLVESALARLASAEQAGHTREVTLAKLELAKQMLARNLASQGLEFARLARSNHPSLNTDPLSLEIDIILGAGLQASGHTSDALDVLLEATSHAEQLGLTDLELRSRLNLSSAFGRAGQLDEASVQIERGLALARKTANAEMEVRYLLNAGRVSQARGDGRLSQHVEEAASIMLDPPDPELERMILLAGASSALVSGNRALAMDRAERSLAAALVQENEYYRAFSLEYLARLGCELPPSNVDPIAQFVEAAAIFDTLDYPHDSARLRRYWATCLESRSQYQEALALEREAGILQRRSHERLRVEAMEASAAAFRSRERSTTLARLEAENNKLAQERQQQSARLAWMIAGLAALLAAAIWQAAHLRILQSRRASDRQMAERQAELLAITGHEIRNPAQCLLGVLESGTLQADANNPRALNSALSAARLVASLASDLLQLAKLEQGFSRPAQIKPLSLGTLLGETSILATQGRNLDAQCVSIELASDLPTWFSSDASRLSQILLNLTTNALAYSNDLPVLIRSRRDTGKQRLLIEVLDQGPGLTQDDIDILALPFRRGHSSARNPHGSGLGLAISMRLATLLGGSLLLCNREGGGAIAQLELPWTPSPEPPDEAQRMVTSWSTRPKKMRVLVVDDDPLPRHGLAILLASLGCLVDEAENGEGLRTALAAETYDLLIVDLNLGTERGTDLLDQLLGTVRTPRPYTAIVSGDAEDSRLRSAQPTVDAWLCKPVSQRDAVHLLEQLSPESTME